MLVRRGTPRYALYSTERAQWAITNAEKVPHRGARVDRPFFLFSVFWFLFSGFCFLENKKTNDRRKKS